MNNYRKIKKRKNQIQVEYSNQSIKEKTSSSKKKIPRRTVHVLNRAAIQMIDIRNRNKATVEWVNEQHKVDKFENHEPVVYSEPVMAEDELLDAGESSISLSKFSYLDETEEQMNYAAQLILLACCCMLNNV